MTPEERFAQIESILLQNTSAIATLLENRQESGDRLTRAEDILLRVVAQQSINQGEIAELKGIVQNVSDSLVLLIDERRLDREEWKVMQSEIRGLQVENHRILERLEGHTSDGHGG